MSILKDGLEKLKRKYLYRLQKPYVNINYPANQCVMFYINTAVMEYSIPAWCKYIRLSSNQSAIWAAINDTPTLPAVTDTYAETATRNVQPDGQIFCLSGMSSIKLSNTSAAAYVLLEMWSEVGI